MKKERKEISWKGLFLILLTACFLAAAAGIYAAHSILEISLKQEYMEYIYIEQESMERSDLPYSDGISHMNLCRLEEQEVGRWELTDADWN